MTEVTITQTYKTVNCGKEGCHMNFAVPQTVFDKRSERPAHPVLHRQDESRFGPIVNRRRKKIAARLHEQALHARIPPLNFRRQSEDVLDELVIQKRHAHFQ